MEKELLKKIYLLREIKPKEDWKENAKEDILREEVSPLLQPRLLMTGAFVLLLAVAFTLPLLSQREGRYVEPEEEEEKKVAVEEEKEEVEVAQVEEEEEVVKDEDDGETVVAVTEESDLMKGARELDEGVRELQRQVLGVYIAQKNEEEPNYTDKELAEHLVAEVEKMTSFQIMTEENEEEAITEMEEAMEEERYDDVISLYFKVMY